MPVVSSQYWNSVHGFTPDDVRRDREGLQTMLTLGKNMGWLLKSMEASRRQGICSPHNGFASPAGRARTEKHKPTRHSQTKSPQPERLRR